MDSANQIVNQGTAKITVAPKNDRPEIEPISTTTFVDTPVIIDLAPHVSDPDEGETFTYKLSTTHAVKEGQVDIAPDGKATFTPSPGYIGSGASFHYQVFDSGGLYQTAEKVSITVQANDGSTTETTDPTTDTSTTDTTTTTDPTTDTTDTATTYSTSGCETSATTTGENHPPIVPDVELTLVSDDPAINNGFRLRNGHELNVTDPECDTITIEFSTPSHGIIQPNANGKDTYYLEKDFTHGTDSFTYTATETSTATPLSATGKITLNIERRKPRAKNAELSTSVNTPFEFDPKLYMEDDQTPAEQLTAKFYATDYTVNEDSINRGYKVLDSDYYNPGGGLVTYTPPKDYVGEHKFQIEAIDPEGHVSTPKGVITVVIGPNKPPYLKGGQLTLDEGGSTSLTLAGRDPEGDTLSYAVKTTPTHGNVEITGATALYTAYAGHSGKDQFSIVAKDSKGNESKPARFDIQINKINDVPTVEDIAATTGENQSVEITLKGSDPDFAEYLSYVVTQSDHGSTDITGNVLTFTPQEHFHGNAIVKYKVTDGELSSEEGTITITVNDDGVNQPPVANSYDVTINEDIQTKITLPASDPEGDALTFTISQAPSLGDVALQNGVAVYTPHQDAYGSDTFTYVAKDSAGNASETATVSVKVRPIPDPVITNHKTGMTLTHLQPLNGSTEVHFWDNLLSVTTNSVLSDSEKNELLNTAKNLDPVTAFFNEIEQDPLTLEEAGGKVDPSQTGYGIYTLELDVHTVEDLEEIATELQSLSFVASAALVLEDSSLPEAAETDIEEKSMAGNQYDGSGPTSMPVSFYNHQLQGALEFLRAYQEQVSFLAPIILAQLDSGVCASAMNSDKCTRDNGLVDAFAGVITAGPNHLVGQFQAGEEEYEIGLVDPERRIHGSTVATIMAAKSNGSVNEPTARMNLPSSGILGSVYGLDYNLKSYSKLRTGHNLIEGKPNTELMSLLDMCGISVTNHSYGPLFSQYTENPEVFDRWHDRLDKARENCPVTLFVNSAGNDGHPLDGSDDFAMIRTKSSRLSNYVNVQATVQDFFSEDRFSMSNYGSDAPIAVSMKSTSFSAPFVTATSSLLKSIDSKLYPDQLIDFIVSTGKPTDDTGAAYLDIGAAVLKAIHNKRINFTPITTKFLQYQHNTDLTSVASMATGTYSQNSKWSFDNKKQRLTIDSEQKVDGKANGKNLEYLTIHKMKKHHLTGLGVVKDSIYTKRDVPVLTVLPQTQSGGDKNVHQLKGKFTDEEVDITTEFPYQYGTKYCLNLNYDVNSSTDTAIQGWQVPLARQSQTSEFAVPYQFNNITLNGNILAYWTSEEPLPALDDFEMLCDPDLDVADGMGGGDAAYQSFMDTLNSQSSACVPEEEDAASQTTEPAFEACEQEQSCHCEDTSPWNWMGLCGALNNALVCDYSDPCAPPEDSGTPPPDEEEPDEEEPCLCSAKYEEPVEYKVNVQASIEDIQCEATSQAYNTYLIPEDGDKKITIKGKDHLVQTFQYETADKSATPCQATINITLNVSHDMKYQATGFCQDTTTASYTDTVTHSMTVNWNLEAGAFPSTDILNAINEAATNALASSRTADKSIFERPLLPPEILPPSSTTPDIGTNMKTVNWAPGIGPVFDKEAQDGEVKLIGIEKLDRTVK